MIKYNLITYIAIILIALVIIVIDMILKKSMLAIEIVFTIILLTMVLMIPLAYAPNTKTAVIESNLNKYVTASSSEEDIENIIRDLYNLELKDSVEDITTNITETKSNSFTVKTIDLKIKQVVLKVCDLKFYITRKDKITVTVPNK